MRLLIYNGKTSRYTYNAAGECIVKSHGYLEGVYVNGAPQGLTFHETEDYTIYPAPILSVTRQRFTKHYFIGDRRIASKIGAGIFQNAYGHGANVVTAGQKDYQMRMMQIERQREDYYRKLGTPPGVPTMKGATAEPENTHEGYNTIIRELGDHSVPDGWIQRPKRNAVPGTPPGPPVQWDKAEDPDDMQPGYGYVPADTAHHEDIFYYHTDHLGSTSYITDAKANVAQFDAYLPYGELLVDEHSSTEEMPYKFNGKEFDEETGLYYYGARYMNPRTSLWYGVDPLAEKYVSVGGYVYCVGNPVKLIDPNGLENLVVVGNQGNSPNSDRSYVAITNKRHFLEAGLQEAIRLKTESTKGNEPTTMLVYRGNYSNSELGYYKQKAHENGIGFQIAGNTYEIENYINRGDLHIYFSKDNNRFLEDNKITDFSYVGHGWTSALLTGYNALEEGKDYDALYTANLQPSAFSINCNVRLNACASGFDVMDDFVNRLVGGLVTGYRVTTEWGEKGIGSSRAFDKMYFPANDNRRNDPDRKSVPISLRIRMEKGKRK